MKKNILEIYALIVCFFAVIGTSIGLGAGTYNLIRFAAPEFTYSEHGHPHAGPKALEQTTKTEVKKSVTQKVKRKKDSGVTEPTVEEATPALAPAMTASAPSAQALQAEKHRGEQGFVRNLILLVISGFMLLVHWGIASGARNSDDR